MFETPSPVSNCLVSSLRQCAPVSCGACVRHESNTCMCSVVLGLLSTIRYHTVISCFSSAGFQSPAINFTTLYYNLRILERLVCQYNLVNRVQKPTDTDTIF